MRAVAAVWVMAFGLSLAVGVWVTFPSILWPTAQTVPVLLGVSLALSMVAVVLVVPSLVSLADGAIRVSSFLGHRAVLMSTVRRVRVLPESRVDRFAFGKGRSHTVALERGSPGGPEATIVLRLDGRAFARLRAALADQEWIDEA